MAVSEHIGKQHLHRLALELVGTPTEELLDLRVGSPDGTVSGNDEDAVRGRVEDRLIFIYR
jgi:hypothetical protein